MKDALAIHRTLLEHEKPHEIVRLPRAISSADELPEVLGLPAVLCLAVRVFGVAGPTGVGGRDRGAGGYRGGDPDRRDRAGGSGRDGKDQEGKDRVGRDQDGADRDGADRDRSDILVAVIVESGTRLTPAAVGAAAGTRHAKPAAADLVNAITDYAAPLVAPLLLPAGVRVLLDRDLLRRVDLGEVVYTPTGEPWTALGIRAGDLITLCSATPVDLTRRVPGASRRPRHVRVQGPRWTREARHAVPDQSRAPRAVRRGQVDQDG